MDNPQPSNNAAETTKKRSWVRVVILGRQPRYTLIRIAVLLAASFVVFKFILLPIRVTGISMLPAYKDRSINLVNCLAYRRHQPERGDVVSIRYAGKHLMLMKRIIALPGETVEFKNGRVIVDGRPLDEPYEKTASDWNVPPVKLDADEYFVVGDNRTMPAEDHVFGKVSRDRIIGKVVL